MNFTFMMRTEKEANEKKHNKRKKKENQNFASRIRLFVGNNEDLITGDLKCNQHCLEHNIYSIPKMIQSTYDKDHMRPLLLSKDGNGHINHRQQDRNCGT